MLHDQLAYTLYTITKKLYKSVYKTGIALLSLLILDPTNIVFLHGETTINVR